MNGEPYMEDFKLMNKDDWNDTKPERKVQNLSIESLNMDILLPCFMDLVSVKPTSDINFFLTSIKN